MYDVFNNHIYYVCIRKVTIIILTTNKMNANFFTQYDNLPTRTDQKNVRYLIITRAKAPKNTFYSWRERKVIPDEKANKIALEVIEEYKKENNIQ
jgi:hypothetical protein